MHVCDVEQITESTNNNLKSAKSTTKLFQIWVMSFRARIKSTAKDVIYGSSKPNSIVYNDQFDFKFWRYFSKFAIFYILFPILIPILLIFQIIV